MNDTTDDLQVVPLYKVLNEFAKSINESCGGLWNKWADRARKTRYYKRHMNYVNTQKSLRKQGVCYRGQRKTLGYLLKQIWRNLKKTNHKKA